jgi:predicted CXXCH cytochrome family protein
MTNMKNNHLILSGGIILAVFTLCVSVFCQFNVAEAGEGSIYTFEVQPLTLEECARCHSTHYNWLKDNGGRHQTVACTECHEVFHAYNPLRNNYADIMPKCSSCHDIPHGSAEPVTKCLECHTNPHQPLVSIPAPDKLEGRCQLCHSEVADSLQAEVSKHTEQECSSCHSDKHGRIPLCAECHENHSPMVVLETPDCLACHPVHTPLKISYPLTQAKEVCAGCHDQAYQLLQERQTKHSVLTCAKCHPVHGQLPACQDCHGKPHSEIIHQKFAQCGDCHGIAHDIVARP